MHDAGNIGHAGIAIRFPVATANRIIFHGAGSIGADALRINAGPQWVGFLLAASVKKGKKGQGKQ